MPLTALEVKNAKPGRHGDGKGLYLVVKPTGSRSWVLRVVQAGGKRLDVGLGSVDILTLSEARDKAAEGRKMAKDGLNPAKEWRKGREAIPSFEVAARRCYEDIKAGWKNPKHAAQWLSTLEAYAFPKIGDRRVDKVDSSAVAEVLLPIWLKIPETARRVRQRVLSVLDYAHAHHWRENEAPNSKTIGKALGKQPRNGDGHFTAIPYEDLPGLMKNLRVGEATAGRLGLMFTILTAARSGEVRGATWGEIDLERALWSIPGDRMKAGKPHNVPLSDAAIGVLQQASGLFAGKPDEPVFRGQGRGKTKALSDMTLAKALRSAGGGDATPHGMRSAFRDWCAEKMPTVPAAVAEACLAHTIKDKVEAAYLRTKFIDQRRDLLGKWAQYLDRQSNVIQLAQAAS